MTARFWRGAAGAEAWTMAVRRERRVNVRAADAVVARKVGDIVA